MRAETIKFVDELLDDWSAYVGPPELTAWRRQQWAMHLANEISDARQAAEAVPQAWATPVALEAVTDDRLLHQFHLVTNTYMSILSAWVVCDCGFHYSVSSGHETANAIHSCIAAYAYHVKEGTK